jgi:type I restriction enzyme S subunit
MSVPKLRFPEFRDAGEWEEKKLGEIASPVSEKSKGKDKEIALTLSAEYGIVSQGDYFGKRIAGENVDRYIKISLNDFVYNDRITKSSTYGTIKRLSQYTSGLVSPIYKCFRFKDSENPVFWEWYFESGNHEIPLQQLVNEGARAGRFNISIQKFLSIAVYSPESSEQQKIADCLSSLDDRITAETQKLDTLKAHKKGLMQQLFPVEGETLPKLRFPEFRDAGEWEERKLGELANFSSGGTPSKDISEYWNGNIPWISASSMYELNIWKSDLSITELGLKAGSRIAKKGSLLILVRGSMLHKRIPLGIALIDVAFNQDIKALSFIGTNINKCFLLYQLIAMEAQLLDMVSATGLGAGKLDTNELKQILVYIPNFPEQQKIADCLSSIDEAIAAQSQAIDLLKLHKKGLMQQLFPSVEEVRG